MTDEFAIEEFDSDQDALDDFDDFEGEDEGEGDEQPERHEPLRADPVPVEITDEIYTNFRTDFGALKPLGPLPRTCSMIVRIR